MKPLARNSSWNSTQGCGRISLLLTRRRSPKSNSGSPKTECECDVFARGFSTSVSDMVRKLALYKR